MNRNPLAIGVLLSLMLWTGVRAWFGSSMELLPEEAYYWTYTQHPALCYYDHPPMLAWVISAGTAVLGNTELGVRLGIIAMSLGSSLLLFLLARIWFDARAALVAVAIFNLLPIYAGTGLLAFPDAPLVFFWLLTMYAVTRAIGAGRGATAYWLLAGVAFGGAMLSKYTAVILAVSLVLFLALSPAQRFWLRRPQPWIASVIAMAMFSIVIIWNSQHEWASFLFQSTRTAGEMRRTMRNVPLFWLFQLAVLTPAGFALLGWAAVRGVRRGWWGREERWTFVAAFSLPLFLLFAAASFKTQVHVNWTAPAFLSLVMGAGALLAGKCEGGVVWQRWAVAMAVFCMVVCLMALVSLRWGVPKFFTYGLAGGWREMAQQVEQAERSLEQATGKEPFILGVEKYILSAELGFYSGEPEKQLNTHALGLPGLGFTYWTRLEKWEGHPAVAVMMRPKPVLLAELREHFDKIDEPRKVEVPAGKSRKRVVHLVNCYSYHREAREQLATQP